MAFNPVTSLTITAGDMPTSGPSGNHIVVYDQDQRMITPASIAWALDSSLVGVVATSDATGFFFTCPADTSAESGSAVATYTLNGVTGSLTVNVVVQPVASLQFSQE